MYEKSYGNIFNKYFIEQLGTIGAITDPWHHIDALYATTRSAMPRTRSTCSTA